MLELIILMVAVEDILIFLEMIKFNFSGLFFMFGLDFNLIS